MDAPVASQLGVFDMFSLGIGPSSSHTVGPMRAGLGFARLLHQRGLQPTRLRVRLFGSLAATGIGHGTNRAVLLGLTGADPETVPAELVDRIVPQIAQTGLLPLWGAEPVAFDLPVDLLFEPQVTRGFHVNALTIDAWVGGDGVDEGEAQDDQGIALTRTYYSVGGGFVLVESPEGVVSLGGRELADADADADANANAATADQFAAPYALPFTCSADLLQQCRDTGASIAQVARVNEVSRRSPAQLDAHLDRVIQAMFECVENGCRTEGTLPGGLGVPRRAPALRERLTSITTDPLETLDWVTLYALAVNEENAAGHRVVTAPTNGAAGIIPAVLGYFLLSRASNQVGGLAELARQCDLWRPTQILQCFPDLLPLARDFLLAASAVGAIIKSNASIAGAEVGCQGEVGSASAMAAAGLAQAFGGTPSQVENAAEIAMEHSLGLTCDPVGGLVQIPCIERNAIGAVKAISAARMALYGDGRHQVSLDVAVETMRQTGVDMNAKYKETSIGGLAVNVVEC